MANHKGRVELWARNPRKGPPDSLKRETIIEYARRFNIGTLIETGTFHGKMVKNVLRYFGKIYSIEISKDLYNEVSQWIPEHVELINGDSSIELPKLMDRIDRKSLFWLDSHWCKNESGKGPINCPILDELNCILRQPYEHVLLMDDARLFGRDGWPRLNDVKDLCKSLKPDWWFEVRNDIIRFHKFNYLCVI